MNGSRLLNPEELAENAGGFQIPKLVGIQQDQELKYRAGEMA